MTTPEEKPHRPEGHGLDSTPTEDSGADTSGAGYVNDDSFTPPAHGEGLDGPEVADEGADVSSDHYAKADHGDEHDERDARDEP